MHPRVAGQLIGRTLRKQVLRGDPVLPDALEEPVKLADA
jgi:hypothetical protein